MQLEDSYEGAVRRLARLSNAGVGLRDDIDARDEERAQRMRDLEELATLATEENERLEKENLRLTQKNERLERDLGRAKETLSRMQQQVLESDREKLRDLLDAPSDTAAAPKAGRSILPWIAALAAVGVIASAMILYHPWQYVHARALTKKLVTRYSVPWLAPHDPLPPPVVEPVAAPVVKVAKPAPVVKPVVAQAAPVPEKKKHAAKKHHHKDKAVAQKKDKPKTAKAAASSDDPLGLGL
jgi:hypothetical protein